MKSKLPRKDWKWYCRARSSAPLAFTHPALTHFQLLGGNLLFSFWIFRYCFTYSGKKANYWLTYYSNIPLISSCCRIPLLHCVVRVSDKIWSILPPYCSECCMCAAPADALARTALPEPTRVHNHPHRKTVNRQNPPPNSHDRKYKEILRISLGLPVRMPLSAF